MYKIRIEVKDNTGIIVDILEDKLTAMGGFKKNMLGVLFNAIARDQTATIKRG